MNYKGELNIFKEIYFTKGFRDFLVNILCLGVASSIIILHVIFILFAEGPTCPEHTI